MRNAFINMLCDLAAADERIWLLTADLGYSVLERFATRFPSRYVNVGIAEQNMMSVAAGLASTGKIVFTYSIVNFATFRCLEQIRNDVCYHQHNVKFVAVGGGFAYGAQGYTHQGVEDVAILRALPNLTILAPGDPLEAAEATRALVAHNGPCYLRLGRGGEPVMHTQPPLLRIGHALPIREGKDVVLLSSGALLQWTLEGAETLAKRGIEATVMSVPCLKPLDVEPIRKAAAGGQPIVTIEEHSVVGGLGSAVAEVLAEIPARAPLLRIGVPDAPYHDVGSQAHMRRMLGDLPEQVKRLLAPQRAAVRQTISVVTPCYNEELNIEECYRTVQEIFRTHLPQYDYEHIFCDNASSDGTLAVLRRIATLDPRVRIIANARNFGPFRSNYNGVINATGDAVLVLMAADLQDPPELIPKFVQLWASGYEVVYGIRAQREESWLMRAARYTFYRLVQRFSDFNIPPDVGEFQLIDRAVVQALRRFEDHYPYIRGMIAHCGFRQVGVPYTWRARKRGFSKNSLRHLIDQSLNGLISFSKVPLRASMLGGVLLSTLSMIYAVIELISNIIHYREESAPGIATLILGMFFFAGVQLFLFGVIGEYIGAIHFQVRKRPLVVERERINFPSQGPTR